MCRRSRNSPSWIWRAAPATSSAWRLTTTPGPPRLSTCSARCHRTETTVCTRIIRRRARPLRSISTRMFWRPASSPFSLSCWRSPGCASASRHVSVRACRIPALSSIYATRTLRALRDTLSNVRCEKKSVGRRLFSRIPLGTRLKWFPPRIVTGGREGMA